MPFPNAGRSRGSSLCTRTRARVPRECERVSRRGCVEGRASLRGEGGFDARFDLGPIDPLIAVLRCEGLVTGQLIDATGDDYD